MGQASEAPPAWALTLLQAQEVQVLQGAKHDEAFAKITEMFSATAQLSSTAVVEIQDFKVCYHPNPACRISHICSLSRANTAAQTGYLLAC